MPVSQNALSPPPRVRRIVARMPTSLRTFDPDEVRLIRLAAQGMARAPGTQVARLVAQHGYVRTLGGCDAYLALRARQRTLRRVELDHALDRGDVQIVPAARGCIYLVPRADVAVCLRVADLLSATRTGREQAKAGIEPGETERVGEIVFTALKKGGPMTTDALRKALPADAVRSLGERGKKIGISSPLPGALRWLEFAGRIERKPEGGRADTERYLWRTTAVNPFADADLPDAPAELHGMLLERFLAHAGIATLAQFAAWSGLSQRDAKAALPHADLLPVRMRGSDDELQATPAVEKLLAQRDAVEHAAAFLPFEDNLVHLYGGPAHLVDDEFLDLLLPSWNNADKPTRLGDARYLSLRGLLANGRLCGFWEYDPDARLAIPRCFRKPGRAAQLAIEELSASVTSFLREEIGHGHSFMLDSDAELRQRLRQLQAIGGDKVVVAARAKAAAKAPSAKGPRGKAAKPMPKKTTGARLGGRTTERPTKTVHVPRPTPRPRKK